MPPFKRGSRDPEESTDSNDGDPVLTVGVFVAACLLVGGGPAYAKDAGRFLDGEEVWKSAHLIPCCT